MEDNMFFTLDAIGYIKPTYDKVESYILSKGGSVSSNDLWSRFVFDMWDRENLYKVLMKLMRDNRITFYDFTNMPINHFKSYKEIASIKINDNGR